MQAPMSGNRDYRTAPRRGFGMLLLTIAVALGSLVIGPNAAADPVRILAFGDSLTAGYGLDAADSFPARLERTLREQGHEVEVINAGVSGDTTSGGLARLDWALAEQPDAVILALGANDGLRAIDPAVTRENLDRLIGQLKERGLPVLLAGMLAPPNLGRAYGERFNAIYPELADKHDVLLYPFFLEGVAAEAELNQDDGIHPNPRGVAVMVERMLPLVERLIARAEENP